MGMGGRRMAAGVAAGVLAAVLAGCSSGGSKGAAGTASGAPSAASTAAASTAAGTAAASAPADPAAPSVPAGTAAASGAASAPGAAPTAAAPVAAPSADLEAALLDDKLVGQVLPDAKAMAGWEEEKRQVDTADHSVTCTAAKPCTGKPLSASVRFSSGDVVTRFIVETLPSRDAAKSRLKESYASYAAGPFKKIDTPALGSEGQAFQGPLAEGEGVGIVVRSGTVVASVTTEGGPVDVAATRRFAVMLVKRIEQAQAGTTPDAGPGPA
ncbi:MULTISPECIES: hypothetical protein [unclassified Kitasatospora]|uniref:hypothetical protein n=1 Tax=unclassified Kitasatospora TaxID=2633591 RepID=UPI0034025B06